MVNRTKGILIMGKDLKGRDLGKGFSQRKDGRYEARAVICGEKIDIYDKDLKTLKRTFEVKKAMLQQNSSGMCSTITLNEWYREWFDRCKAPQLKNDVSRKTYDRRIRNTYCRLLGDKRIANVLQINIQEATSQLVEEGYTYRTVKEALGILKECCEIAIVNRIIPVNPCIGIKIKDANISQERRVLTPKEQKIFLDEVQNKYYYEAYKILLLTGMRIGDDDDKIRLNQRKPSKYKGLSRFGPEKNLQRINKFMKERPTFYKKLIQMKENFRFYLRCFYCITKVVILQFNSEKQDRISS